MEVIPAEKSHYDQENRPIGAIITDTSYVPRVPRTVTDYSTDLILSAVLLACSQISISSTKATNYSVCKL